MGPEDNPADDVQPTKEDWESYEAQELSSKPTSCSLCGAEAGIEHKADCPVWKFGPKIARTPMSERENQLWNEMLAFVRNVHESTEGQQAPPECVWREIADDLLKRIGESEDTR
jgi:hypothetical protein